MAHAAEDCDVGPPGSLLTFSFVSNSKSEGGANIRAAWGDASPRPGYLLTVDLQALSAALEKAFSGSHKAPFPPTDASCFTGCLLVI